MSTAHDWLIPLFPDLGAWRAEPVESGMSGAAVLRLSRKGEPAQYLKAGRAEIASAIDAEAGRLAWLASAGLAVPRVLAHVRNEAVAGLRLAAVAGRCAAEIERPALAVADAIGRTFARLHAIDPATCPFDAGLAERLAEAAASVAAGRVDPAEFDERNAGFAPEDLLRRLMASIPIAADLVVTHGDATLDNLIVSDCGAVAFLDCGRLGRADRYQDLALIARDIRCGWGSEAETAFWHAYGIAVPDAAKLAFYELLEEFS